jgi:hypothetical protein
MSDKKTEINIESYMERDTQLRVPNQEYAVVSIIGHGLNQTYEKTAVKIRGVFNDIERAKSHALALQKIDDMFDNFVVEMYAWLILPPEKLDLDIETHYADQKLEELIQGQIESTNQNKAEFERHKVELAGGAETKEIVDF